MFQARKNNQQGKLIFRHGKVDIHHQNKHGKVYLTLNQNQKIRSHQEDKKAQDHLRIQVSNTSH